RAATAGGTKPKTVGECAAFKRTGYLFSVCVISDGWSHAVCVLPGASRELRQGRQNLSDVHCQPHAAWNFWIVDRRHFGRCDVESECGAEFPVVELDYGLLCADGACCE